VPRSLAVRARAATGAKLGPAAAFWLLAATLSLLLFASSAPSPLYIVYQAEWGFSAVTLTSVFAVYALALLAALVIAGSVSDHAGRRPTLLFALAIELAGMLVFAEARSVGWLFAARVLQGVATGIAMGAISAALLDFQPEASPRLGALLGVAAPLTGLAAGALGAGLLVEYGPDPTRLVYWLLLGGFAVATIVAIAVPETVRHDGSWLRSLRPRVAIPDGLQAAFIATIPCLTATWALGGLVLSLGPSLTATVLGDGSHTAGGLPIFIMAGVSALASIRLRDAHARSTARGGLTALIVGIAVVLLALHERSIPVFFLGTGVAGLGFGPAFAGAFRSLSNRAPADQRAGLVSAILAVSYLAFSLPAVAAGAAVSRIGLERTADVYGIVLIVLAVVALALSGRLQDPQSEPSATRDPVAAGGRPAQ
jgi:MFS family permease